MKLEQQFVEIKDRLALLEQQVKILKDHSHKHKDESDCVYPYNPDYNSPVPPSGYWFCERCGNGFNAPKINDYVCHCGNQCEWVLLPSGEPTISISRKVAEEWLRHCRDFKHQSFHAELKNELRRAIGKGK